MILLVNLESFRSKALQFLGLPSKTYPVKVNNTMIFETEPTFDVFKNYFSTLADNLLKNSQPLSTNILFTL